MSLLSQFHSPQQSESPLSVSLITTPSSQDEITFPTYVVVSEAQRVDSVVVSEAQRVDSVVVSETQRVYSVVVSETQRVDLLSCE